MDWPDRFSIWNPEGEVVLHGRVQAWDIWGGDYPYNDAFSYEFYFEENNTIALQNYYMTPCASFIGKKRKRACLGY